MLTHCLLVPAPLPNLVATEAVKLYTQALAGAPDDGTLHGNRSAAHLALGLLDDAAWDARRAVSLRPDWPKAYYRLGCACLALGQWAEAEAALAQGLQLEPGAEDVAAKLRAARQQLAAEASAREAQAATERRGVVAQLRAARQADRRLVQRVVRDQHRTVEAERVEAPTERGRRAEGTVDDPVRQVAEPLVDVRGEHALVPRDGAAVVGDEEGRAVLTPASPICERAARPIP